MPEQNAAPLLIPVSTGELIDKITILVLKSAHAQGERLANVTRELAALQQIERDCAPAIPIDLRQQLAAVNAELWSLEDDIRALDARQDFGAQFVALARRIHQLNDRRHAIKRAINVACGSALIEEKVYGSGCERDQRPTT